MSTASHADETGAEDGLRIHELALLSGLTVRNIRAYHERGLLPPPRMRVRTGYYGPEHLGRLRLIEKLRAEGLKLEGIKRLIEVSNADTAGLLRVKDAAEAREQVEQPELVTISELRARLALTDDDAAAHFITTSERLGVLAPLDGERVRLLSPSLIDAAEAVVRAGIAIDRSLVLVERTGDHARAIALDFVDAFVDDVWKPFAAAGMPEEDWPRVAEAMQSTRAVAADVVLAVFRQWMSRSVEATLASIAQTIGDGRADDDPLPDGS